MKFWIGITTMLVGATVIVIYGMGQVTPGPKMMAEINANIKQTPLDQYPFNRR